MKFPGLGHSSDTNYLAALIRQLGSNQQYIMRRMEVVVNELKSTLSEIKVIVADMKEIQRTHDKIVRPYELKDDDDAK